MMKILYTVVLVLVILFIITFSIANDTPIVLEYYDMISIKTPIYVVIFVSFLTGVLFTGFIGIVERFRLNRTITKQNKVIRELRRELRALDIDERGLPAENGLDRDADKRV